MSLSSLEWSIQSPLLEPGSAEGSLAGAADKMASRFCSSTSRYVCISAGFIRKESLAPGQNLCKDQTFYLLGVTLKQFFGGLAVYPGAKFSLQSGFNGLEIANAKPRAERFDLCRSGLFMQKCGAMAQRRL